MPGAGVDGLSRWLCAAVSDRTVYMGGVLSAGPLCWCVLNTLRYGRTVYRDGVLTVFYRLNSAKFSYLPPCKRLAFIFYQALCLVTQQTYAALSELLTGKIGDAVVTRRRLRLLHMVTDNAMYNSSFEKGDG
jgi:hypothetical protein